MVGQGRTCIFLMFTLKKKFVVAVAVVAVPVEGGMKRNGSWRQSMQKGLWQDGIHGRVR